MPLLAHTQSRAALLGRAGTLFTGAPLAFTSAAPLADGQCWFHEPRALMSSGKLWFGTNGSNNNTQATGRATLYEVNEASASVTSKDLATGTDWGDDHNYPVVMQRSDGRLVVFYCAHRKTAPIRYRVSVNVGTIVGGWSQEYTIAVDATNPTYPSPVRLSAESNKVYLFFRNGIAATLSYLTSADLDTVTAPASDGATLGATPTWAAEKQLTTSSGTQGIYTKVRSNGVDRIDVLITDAVGDTTGTKNDIRHGYYVGGNWYTSLGAALGTLPITFSSFSAVATSGVPDSLGDVWVWDIQRRPTTNLVTNESAFNLWTTSAVSVSANVAANPLDGTATADRMTDSATSAVHNLQFNSVSFTSGRVYKFSVLAKYETAQFLQLLLPNAAFGANAYANFDIQNGTVGTVGASATASIEAMSATGWYRIAIRATATGTSAGVGGVYGASLSTSIRAETYLGAGLTRLLYQGIVEEESIEALFVRFASVSDHRYYYARWNGLTWSKSEIDAGTGGGTPDTRSSAITDGGGAVEGYYSPGLYLDSQEEGVIYCSVGFSTYSVMYRYVTTNRGTTWARARVSGMVKENVRPFVPQGRSANYGVLWASGDYHFYDFNATNDTSYGYTTRVNIASRSYSTTTAAPVNTVIPAISGTAQVGNSLTGSTGTWTGDVPMTFAYQWAKDAVDIGGATSSSYTVLAGDVGHTLTVRVAATNGVGSASATSSGASGLPTNLLLHSEDVNQWSASATTNSLNVANEPVNGAATADRVLESSTTSSHSVNSVNITFANATAYTFSVYVKFETRQFLQLLYGSGAFGTTAYANFDIQNGTVQTVGASATASIVSVGSGWYRIIMTATSTAGAAATAAVFGITAGNSARALSYLGSSANTWLQADAQVETGSAANTYVPTA